jgi:hypothetical protein
MREERFFDPDELLKHGTGSVSERFQALAPEDRARVVAAWRSKEPWWKQLQDDPGRPAEICACDCHRGRIQHIMACCAPCPDCRLPIVRGLEAAHRAACGQYLGPVLESGV